MEQLATIAFYAGVIAYSTACTLFFLHLARREPAADPRRAAPVALAIGAGAHALHVVAASLLSNVCPVSSPHFALSLTALVAVVVYLPLRSRFKLHAMGAVVAPIALTFLVGAQFVDIGRHPAGGFPPGLLAAHVTANLLGVALFLLAGAAGAFYLVQERKLREKRPVGVGMMAKLPPLDALDRTEHRLLLAGFPLLTFGIVTGAVFASRLDSASTAEMLRAALGYATWVLVAGVLLMRAALGWRGRRSAYGTLAGVACVLIVIVLYAIRPAIGGAV
jgi:ABC-type uncharacterized transport system permease subunit